MTTTDSILEVIDRAVFNEYDRAYTAHYKGEEDNSQYLQDLEEAMELLSAIQSDNSATKVFEQYDKEDLDVETIIETAEQVLHSSEFRDSSTPVTPPSPSIE